MAFSFLRRLLPASGMSILGWEMIGSRLIVAIRHRALVAHCSACGAASSRIHGWYRRHVEDLPCSGHRVMLDVHVRRFRCDNTACPQRTFTENFSFLAHRQRRTSRAQTVLWHLGLALSGAAGSRLAKRLGISISGETILRLLKRDSAKIIDGTKPEPVAVGIDDWAFKRGHRYGTILVDLERRCPLDLLPDRNATSSATWLRRHQTIRFISRDRAGVYAEAAARGAPQATQVVDRWHLLKNLGQTLERALNRCQRDIREVSHSINVEDKAITEPILESQDMCEPRPPRARQQKMENRAARFARYETVMRHHRSGMAIRAIARITILDRRTVRNWINAGGFPERAQRCAIVSKLDPHRTYLARRWREGCRNAAKLHAELLAEGFRGGYSTVRKAVQAFRKNSPRIDESPNAVPRAVPSIRRVCCWLLGRRGSALTDDDGKYVKRFVQRLINRSPQIATIRQLALEFTDMIKRRAYDTLACWIRKAQASGVPEIRRFAIGIDQDYGAVHAALRTPYSNGMVEGHVNRLKLLKRQMYGRASFQLLRTRVLNRV